VFGWSIAAGVIAVLSLSGWLAELFPLLAGYREPHKLVMVVALGYAVLGAYGLAVIIRRLRRPGLAIAPFLLLPLIWTPTMLWGFNGQLRAAHYPQDWYIAQSLLNREPAGKVLFLPWHQYMTFSFAGRIIANPAEQFFGSRIVASHDPEYANLGPDLTYPLSHTVQTEVLPNARHATFGQQLAKHGIHYIMVAKEYDYQQYDYLNKRRDLLTIFDGQVLKLYRFRQKETV
jgi:hypothetical protein